MLRRHLIEERLTHSAIGAFFDVYNKLGFGFLETVYTMALERELAQRGHHVGAQSREGPPPPLLTVQRDHQSIHVLVAGLRRIHRVLDADVGSRELREEADDVVPVHRPHDAARKHAVGELPLGIGRQRCGHRCCTLVAR